MELIIEENYNYFPKCLCSQQSGFINVTLYLSVFPLLEVLKWHLPEATSDLQGPYIVLALFALPKNSLFVSLTWHLKYICDTAGGCTGISCLLDMPF